MSWIKTIYQRWSWTVMSASAMWLLQRRRNIVKKFWWNHIYDCSAKAPFSLHSASTSEDNDVHSRPHPQTHKCHQNSSGHCPPHINDGSTPLNIFMLYFAEIVILLVVETNRYYHWCFVSFINGPSSQNYETEAEMFVFLAVTIQIGHCLPDQLT